MQSCEGTVGVGSLVSMKSRCAFSNNMVFLFHGNAHRDSHWEATGRREQLVATWLFSPPMTARG